MDRSDWSRLSKLQVGQYAELFAKMEFARYGFEVYTSEVDERSIDFVARRRDGDFYQVQVKSLRGWGYIFIPKAKFDVHARNVVAVVLLHAGKEPDLYLIPMTAWQLPNSLLVGRDYGEGMKSKPEWGLNLSAKNLPLLDAYRFSDRIGGL